MSDMKGYDGEVLKVIRQGTGPDGVARNLFRLACVGSDLDYRWARTSLRHLELLGCVQVERRGAPRPLVMRLNCSREARCVLGSALGCPLAGRVD